MKPVVDLYRAPEFADSTFGCLVFRDFRRATLELPWRDNRPDVSCIPPGVHPCWWAWSPRHSQFVYHVGAPGRVGVEIDICNWASELRGCLALGRKVARFAGKGWGVTHSGSSRRAFHRLMRKRPFDLRIQVLDH